MDFFRIGKKLISRSKINSVIEKILKMRVKGLTQEEIAKELGIERSFISRLEKIGEIRKGKRIALIGFPVKNKREIEEIAKEKGVDFILVFTQREREVFISKKTGARLFNEIVDLIASLASFDVIIFLGSDRRVRLVEEIFKKEVIGISLGPSPIKEGKYVDPKLLEDIIDNIQKKE